MGEVVSNKFLEVQAHAVVVDQYNAVVDAVMHWRDATVKLQAAIIKDADAERRKLTDDEHRRLADLSAEFVHVLHVLHALSVDADSLCLSAPMQTIGGAKL